MTRRFFGQGEIHISGGTPTNFFHTKDHLGSIRTMTNDSGVVQASFSFDPYGRVIRLEGAAESDFGFAGYYVHSRSGLNLTRTRAYSPSLGRWISRDPIGEAGGLNMFVYALNAPSRFVDPLGLDVAIVITPPSKGLPPFGHCAVIIGDDIGGWKYLSNSLGGDSKSGMQFRNLNEFYGYFHDDYSRERTSWFDNVDDAGAQKAAEESIARGYRLGTNNCSHTCRDALRGAGINMPEGGIAGTGAGNTPQQVFNDANKAGGQPPPF